MGKSWCKKINQFEKSAGRAAEGLILQKPTHRLRRWLQIGLALPGLVRARFIYKMNSEERNKNKIKPISSQVTLETFLPFAIDLFHPSFPRTTFFRLASRWWTFIIIHSMALPCPTLPCPSLQSQNILILDLLFPINQFYPKFESYF